MPEYLVHSSRERARFRHPLFARDERKMEAMEFLRQFKGIVGIKPGAASILVFLEPEANVQEICAALEKSFPELLVTRPETKVDSKPGMVCKPKKTPHEQEKRQRQLKTLLTAGITTVGLAAVGLHHLHAWAGGIFALLATQHVWQRRKRL